MAAFNAGDYGHASALFKGVSQALAGEGTHRSANGWSWCAKRIRRYDGTTPLTVTRGQKAPMLLDCKPAEQTPLTMAAAPVGSHRLELEAHGARTAHTVEIRPRYHTTP